MQCDGLKEKYPRLIPSDFPFECNDGWAEILESFFATVDAVLPPDTRMLLWADVYGRTKLPTGRIWILKQVKEKLGTLRIYYDMGGVGDDVHQAIAEARELAEARSFHTCEHCGKRGWPRNDHGWLFTACDRHAMSDEDSRMVPRDEEAGWMSFSPGHDGSLDQWRIYDPETDRIVPCPPPDWARK